MISNPNRLGDELTNELRSRKVFYDEEALMLSLSYRELIREKEEDDRLVELMLIEEDFELILSGDDDFFFIWDQASNA